MVEKMLSYINFVDIRDNKTSLVQHFEIKSAMLHNKLKNKLLTGTLS